MGIWDDFWGDNGLAKKATGAVAASGVPGWSQAAGMVGGAAWGDEESAQSLPPYEKFAFDQEAFTGDPAQRMQRAADEMAIRNQMSGLAGRQIGQENSGMFQEMLGEQRRAALGQGPSVAELQMRDAMGRAGQQQQSAAGSARGAGSLALAQMNAANQISGIQQNASTQGAMLRAQEMDNARKGMFGAISADRDSSISGEFAKARAIQGYGQSLDNRFEGDRARGMAYQGAQRGEHAAAQGRSYANVQADMAGDAMDKKAAADASAASTSTMMEAGKMALDQNNKDQDRKLAAARLAKKGV